jgi:DNA-binding phage protein
MTMAYAPFDAAEYLNNDETIAEYLSAATEDSNLDVFLAALGGWGEGARYGADRHQKGRGVMI